MDRRSAAALYRTCQRTCFINCPKPAPRLLKYSSSYSFVQGWQPSHVPKLPVYQAALDYLANDSKSIADGSETLGSRALRNDPGLREQVWQGTGDTSNHAVREMLEQRWREEGQLGQLMESLHRARIVSDLIRDIDPTADLQVHAKLASKNGDAPVLKRLTPGQPLPVARALEPPTFTAQVFHAEEALYTLMLIDADVPDQINQTFQAFLHLLVVNVPLSATKSEISTSSASLSYIPPHPANGSPMHRYTALLLSQDNVMDLNKCMETSRDKFSAREWLKAHGGCVSGASFWTSKWSSAEADLISQVYEQRGVHEPRYGVAPRAHTGTPRRRPLARLPLNSSSDQTRVPWESGDRDLRRPFLVTRQQIVEAKRAEQQHAASDNGQV